MSRCPVSERSRGPDRAFSGSKWAEYNVQVNTIAPGWFPTHMSDWVIRHKKDLLLRSIPLGRFGSEDDLKGAAVFLASDASAYITGHVLVVDGGQSVW